MNASIPYAGKLPHVVDVDAKVVGSPQSGVLPRLLLLTVIAALVIFSVASWVQIDSLKSGNETLTSQVAQQSQKIAGLETELASTTTLRRDLALEIQRKNVLAVENTRLKGRVAQGERDLAQALEKLKAYEKPKAGQKKK
jgi:septal ring factor EnvC (AmiA/AmiB activator)